MHAGIHTDRGGLRDRLDLHLPTRFATITPVCTVQPRRPFPCFPVQSFPIGASMDLQTIFDRPPVVLVADDDKDIRGLLQAYLESSGCRVVTASNGTE